MAKSKIEKSPYYKEILNKIKNNEKDKDIETWLKEHNESISYKTISRFRKKINKDANIEAGKIKKNKKKKSSKKDTKKTVKEIAEKKVSDEEAYSETVKGIANLLIICEDTGELVPTLIEELRSMDLTPTQMLEMLKVIKDYMKLRLDYAKSKEVEVNINNHDTLNDLFDENLIKEVLEDN